MKRKDVSPRDMSTSWVFTLELVSHFRTNCFGIRDPRYNVMAKIWLWVKENNSGARLSAEKSPKILLAPVSIS